MCWRWGAVGLAAVAERGKVCCSGRAILECYAAAGFNGFTECDAYGLWVLGCYQGSSTVCTLWCAQTLRCIGQVPLWLLC